jgi:hypothetical protein
VRLLHLQHDLFARRGDRRRDEDRGDAAAERLADDEAVPLD